MIHFSYQKVRMFFSQAWLSYHSRFAITYPFGYFTAKFGFAFFQMIFFTFMGKYLSFTNPLYIVIGNIILIPANGGMCGLTLAIGEEREWGTLSYVLGSPASRPIIFLGRAFFYIVDGIFTTLVGFGIAGTIFHLNFFQINLPLLIICVLLVAVTSTGLGFIFGSIYLISRDGWPILGTFLSAIYVLVGVNFPVEVLPGFLKTTAYYLPLTHGLIAARQVLNGASWDAVQTYVGAEALVGSFYILAGYLFLRFIEKRSMISGTLDLF